MSDAPPIQWCPSCKQPMLADGAVCPRCGQPLVLIGAAPTAARVKWYHSVWFVLFMLFFVLGPFGLPILWKSPRFGRSAKIGLTVAVGVYCVWLVVLTIRAAQSAMGHFNDLEKSLLF